MEVTKIKEFTGHTAAIYSLSPSTKLGHFISCGSEERCRMESGDGGRQSHRAGAGRSVFGFADRRKGSALAGIAVGRLGVCRSAERGNDQTGATAQKVDFRSLAVA